MNRCMVNKGRGVGQVGGGMGQLEGEGGDGIGRGWGYVE